MSESFDEAMDTLEREADEPERYCEAFLSVFPIEGAAVSTIGQVLGSETLAASDPIAARLDELQFDLGEGPCWDAMRSAYPVLVPIIRSTGPARWPAFTERVVRDGVSSVFAGMTPSRFWFAKICSRIAFQPMSNLPLNLSIHSWVGWCGACAPPGA